MDGKIVVTGGVGFIGTNLVGRLMREEQSVLVLDDFSGSRHAVKETPRWQSPFVKYHNVDVSRDNQYITIPDICYHLAAVVSIPESLEKPGYTINNNYRSLLNVLEWSRMTTKFPVVFAGTAASYGNVYDNPYAFSKYQGEELCKLYSDLYDIPVVICRFFNVYGPFAPTEGQYVGVVGIFSRLFKENKPLTITGDGTQTRDFIHVEDIVDGLIKCGDGLLGEGSTVITGEVFDLGTGNSYSLNEVVKAFGEDYPIEYIEERQGEMKHSGCDPKKSNEILGWETKNDVLDYIRNTYL